MHTTGFTPLQTPDWQVSDCVHAFPSLHAVPFAFHGFEQIPVAGLHVPTLWQPSLAVHTTGFVPVQLPDWQVSVCVHAFPSLHAVPFGAPTQGLGAMENESMTDPWAQLMSFVPPPGGPQRKVPWMAELVIDSLTTPW